MNIDIVFPDKNERKFLEIGAKLGYGGVCFVYDYQKKSELLLLHERLNKLDGKKLPKIFFGLSAKPTEVNKVKKLADLVVVKPLESEKQNRYVVEKTKTDILFGLEQQKKPDSMHHRNSGLNQVLCKLANKNKVMIGIPFSIILKTGDMLRSRLLGRIAQNIKFCKKYDVEMVVASFAHEPYEMRSPKDLAALCVLLGMHPKEAKNATSRLAERLIFNKRKKNKEIIAEGIEIID